MTAYMPMTSTSLIKSQYFEYQVGFRPDQTPYDVNSGAKCKKYIYIFVVYVSINFFWWQNLISLTTESKECSEGILF